ncbi:MAG TPA: hypothetical protein VMR25_11705 [Planctomycetaceae bacterium]|jgi:hypothetical protein|nr:hypothetical protein [Planctomycetaceae bacterium]
MPGSRFAAALALLAACAALVCGCTLLKPVADVFTFWPPAGGSQSLLPPLRPARDALQIDVVFIERPAGDPLLGNPLWNDIDQVAAFEPSELDGIRQLGMLIGNAGANPCPALERMLRETADPLDAAALKNCMPLKKQTFCLRNTETSSIETNSAEHCTLDLPLLTGAKEKKYDNFKSVLRLTALRLQDGWAKLEFVPEIHHGLDRLRPMVSDGRWQPRESQEIDTLPQRFSLKLHVGEMAIITAAPGNPRSYGHHAFVRDDSANGPLQRVLVVRLSNMSRIDPVYTKPDSAPSGAFPPSVSLSK